VNHYSSEAYRRLVRYFQALPDDHAIDGTDYLLSGVICALIGISDSIDDLRDSLRETR